MLHAPLEWTQNTSPASRIPNDTASTARPHHGWVFQRALEVTHPPCCFDLAPSFGLSPSTLSILGGRSRLDVTSEVLSDLQLAVLDSALLGFNQLPHA